MEFGIAAYGLGYLAGIVSTLSPCVLPLLPIVLATASAAHRFGGFTLAAGLMLSFTAIGIFVATIGAAVGLDDTLFRNGGAMLLIGFGAMMMSTRLQARFGLAASGLGNAGHNLIARAGLDGLRGQFAIGLVLGIVWSPCVGPTLGAALTLASQGKDLAAVASLMAFFGLGAGTPMIVLGSLSRAVMIKARGNLMCAGNWGKHVLGSAMFATGILILTGLDQRLEALMLQASPEWLSDLATRL